MNKNLIYIFIIIFIVFSLFNCKSQIDLPENYVFEQNKKLGRGINLGNALDAPSEGNWGVVLKQEYFKLVSEAGFDSVRIPVRWSNHTRYGKPYTIDKTFMDRVDWAVNEALKNDLNVVLNIHHFTQIMEYPEDNKKKLLLLWKQLSMHYKDMPDNVYFEILNEPCNNLSNELWNDYLASAVKIIRKYDPDRTLIIGPTHYNNIKELPALKLPEKDRNIIVTFHYYSPFNFTHQGAGWVGDDEIKKTTGVTWSGTDNEKNEIIRDFQKALKWAEKENRPLYLGEFGAYNKADMTSRALWSNYIVTEAEKNNISWAYWEFCADFGAYDKLKKEWREELLKALIPGS